MALSRFLSLELRNDHLPVSVAILYLSNLLALVLQKYKTTSRENAKSVVPSTGFLIFALLYDRFQQILRAPKVNLFHTALHFIVLLIMLFLNLGLVFLPHVSFFFFRVFSASSISVSTGTFWIL